MQQHCSTSMFSTVQQWNKRQNTTALSVTYRPPGIVNTVPCAAPPPHVWCPYAHTCTSNMSRDGMRPQRVRSCPASHDQGTHGDRIPHPGSSVPPTTANKRKRHQPKPFSHTSQIAHFGDALSKKKPHNLRIWYNNINGLGSSTLTDKAPDLLTPQYNRAPNTIAPTTQ